MNTKLSESRIDMKTYGLNSFSHFKCTNKDCNDNCCIGWEIDVDEKTEEFYLTQKGEFADFIRKNLTRDNDGCHIRMEPDGRCPFLNNDNLCDIIINCGEDKISYICTHHPRFYEWLYDRVEMGYGLCCEEAARLLLDFREPVSTDAEYILSDNISDILSYARDTAFYIIKNRNFKINERIALFLDFVYDIDDLLFSSKEKEIINLSDKYKDEGFLKDVLSGMKPEGKNDIKNIIDFFDRLEPIDIKWTSLLEKLKSDSEKIRQEKDRYTEHYKESMYKYENLCVYYIYRYFLKAADDNDILSKGKLVVTAFIMNLAMDVMSFAEGYDDKIKNTVLFSKELEYSSDNLELFYREALENEVFSYDNILRVVLLKWGKNL